MTDSNTEIARTIPTKDGPVEAPARVLVVVAHPDDIDFGSAGSIAALTAAGSHVAYCLVTSGDAGDDDMTRTTAELAAEREAEQTAAAAEVGVTDLYWLHHPDGRVENTLDLRRDISRVIRIEKPDVVITQSTEPNWDRIYGSHPDHLATGWATMAAIYPDSRNPRAHTELLEEGHLPHKVEKAWIRSGESNLHVDVTDVIDAKVAALTAHKSQTGWIEDLPKLLRGWAADTAKAAGMPEGRLAESYRVIHTA
ncbi:MAG: PIG-L deacetylase family protein [Acidimicrobiales bacterium]